MRVDCRLRLLRRGPGELCFCRQDSLSASGIHPPPPPPTHRGFASFSDKMAALLIPRNQSVWTEVQVNSVQFNSVYSVKIPRTEPVPRLVLAAEVPEKDQTQPLPLIAPDLAPG